jgi:hypothetical protein
MYWEFRVCFSCAVPLTWFSRKVSQCQTLFSKQLSNFLEIFPSTQCREYLNISSKFLNIALHFLIMSTVLLQNTLQCCFLLWHIFGINANKQFVNVNQLHSKTNCTACLVQSYKIPIACLMFQQWLCVIAHLCTPPVCSPKQQSMLDLSHRAATIILFECSNCL